jgi:FkbM family methyltransferase
MISQRDKLTTYVGIGFVAIMCVAAVLLLYRPSEQPLGASSAKNRVGKPQPVDKTVFPLEIPEGIKTIFINVGTHLDPVLPPADKSVMVLGFEPNLGLLNAVPARERLHMIPAAVGNFNGLAAFHLSSNGGASSSIAKFQDRVSYLDSKGIAYVPVVRLENILMAIDPKIKVTHIKIDAQGYDLEVIKSAGSQLHRFEDIFAEVVINDDLAYYKDVDNSRRSWMAFMEQNGYELAYEDCNGISAEQLAAGTRCEEGNLRFVKKKPK